MNTFDFIKIREKLQVKLSPSRYEHTIAVEFVAAALAMVHDVDMIKAQLAGLLHDCAKHYKNKKKLELCEVYNIAITEIEYKNPELLHGKLGAYVAKDKYCIKDKEILDAITYHTTGRSAMTKLEQIVFIADYIEPNRTKAKNLKQIREIAFKDLDLCCKIILLDTMEYLKESNAIIDQTTERAYHYYCNK